MSRNYGAQFPERPLMSTLSDLLGIPHFTTSRGSTVRRDFLESVATALGASVSGEDKDGLIQLVWETAQGRPMPADRLSNGATVTNRVLQDIVDGVLGGRVSLPRNAPVARPHDTVLEKQVIEAIEGNLDPDSLGGTRTRRLVEQAQREGQDHFRTTVIEAYGATCAMTRTQVPAVLQAAHIAPYRSPQHNMIANGICLRVDIHLLYDRGAIAIHEKTLTVLVKPHLERSEYWPLAGSRVEIPRVKKDRPSVPALRSHRLWAGFPD